MGDIISPFKAAMGGNYKEVENRLMGAIYLHFSLAASPPIAVGRQIKRADKEAAFHEAVRLAGFELDEARRRVLSERIGRVGQTIVTATGAEALPLAPAQLLRVTPGRVDPA